MSVKSSVKQNVKPNVNEDIELKKKQQKILRNLQNKVLEHIIKHFDLDKGEVLHTFFYSDDFINYMKKYKLTIKNVFSPHIIFQKSKEKIRKKYEFSVFKMMIKKTSKYELKHRQTTGANKNKSLTYYHISLLQ